MNSRLELDASLGLLQTLYRGFVQNGVALPESRIAECARLAGGAQRHVARSARAVHACGRDGYGSYFYDLPPNWTRSNPYGLANAKIGWQAGRYEAYVWGRNLLDKDYTVRGFYFGDQPPDFPTPSIRSWVNPGTGAYISSIIFEARCHSLGGYAVLALGGACVGQRLDGVQAVLALSPYLTPFIRRRTQSPPPT